MTENDLLSQEPDFFQLNILMKATPATEGSSRIVYVEASHESPDQVGEIVLQKALKDSVEVFKKFGVLDVDHKSMPSVAAMYGIESPEEWIIGQPIDVTFKGGTTIVKAQLRQGDTPLANRANMVWDGLTKLNPPDRYYASVGGRVLGRDIRIDPETGSKIPVITQTRWDNLALSLQPVHGGLNPTTLTPIGTFAKSLGGFVLSKGLEASYATDAADKTGGAAFGMQSLDTGSPHSYYDFREQLAAALKSGKVKSQSMTGLISFAHKQFNLQPDEAAEWVDRFLGDLKSSLSTRSTK